MAISPQVTGTPPMGSSPAAQASGNPGQSAASVAKIREALRVLIASQSELPPGSKMQLAVSKAILDLSKEFPESEAAPGPQHTALRDIVQKAQQQQMMQALVRSQGAQQQGGAPAGAAPPNPQPEQ